MSKSYLVRRQRKGIPDLKGKQAHLGPIAMRDTKRHMQALNELLQSCSCLSSMPDLQ